MVDELPTAMRRGSLNARLEKSAPNDIHVVISDYLHTNYFSSEII